MNTMKNDGVYNFTDSLKRKILAALWRDQHAFNLYRDVVKPKYFQNPILVDICRVVFSYYDQYNQVPTLDALTQEVTDLCRRTKRKEVALAEYKDTVEFMSEVSLDDLDYIKDKIVAFGKRQALIDSIVEAMDILEKEPEAQYPKIQSLVKDALMVGENVYDLGTNIYENVEERFVSYLNDDDVIERIPTGIHALDNCLGGGLGRTEMGIVVAAPGLGKALSPYTPVLTPNGYRFLKDIQVGDEVISVNGNPTKVTAVYHHEKKSMYRVQFTFGECVCCDEHLWTIEKPEPLTLPLTKIMNMLKGGQKITIPTLKAPVEFEFNPTKQIDPPDPYRLGTLLSRGRYLSEMLDTRMLESLHIMSDVPSMFFIPKSYLQATIDSRKSLFKGFMDNAYIDHRHGCIRMSFQSQQLVEDVKFLAESLCCNVKVEGHRLYIYNAHKIDPYVGAKQKNYVKSVTPVGESSAICITVDDPSQLYVIKDAIVTHNTSTLVSIGGAAIENGYNVLHVSLENNERQITRNYDLRLLKHNIEYIRENVEQSIQAMFNIQKFRRGELRIKKYPTRGATVQTLRTLLDKYKLVQNFIPDVLVVDYGTILKSSVPYADKRNAIESNFEELRALADDYNVALWTAAQGNRGALSKKVVTMGDLAECFAIGNICDVMACLCQTMEEKAKKELRMFLPKIRDNADKMILKGRIMYDIKKVEMDEVLPSDDQQGSEDNEVEDWDAEKSEE